LNVGYTDLIISKNGNIIKIENNERIMEHLELILHPIRMRVVLAAAHRVLTPQKIAELLPDVPQTTLYRHINLLLDGGVLRVVRESKVRGTVERELTLVNEAARIDLEASAALSPEEQSQIFTTFVAQLLADFNRAQLQSQDELPPAMYIQHRLYLTVEELQALYQQMDTFLSTYKNPTRQTSDGSVHPWVLTGITLLDKDEE
jgi:DNA-binding transcriptional ArsR family regulator